ncbi:hypothetical protein M758_7G053600 [Ceratodon purpureus]|nr:hypothetical protein M758_7G053600 [Ceratodon purpureus]
MHIQNARTRNEAISNLKRCYDERDLVSTKQVHDWMMKSGMEQDTLVVNNLLRVYIKCGSLQDARQAFDKLVKKSVITWTTMLGGLAQQNRPEDAMQVFNRMCEEGVQPDAVTYMNILKACTSPALTFKWGKQIHAHIRSSGLEADDRVGNALLKMYVKSGHLEDAQQVLNEMGIHRDAISWNMIIGGYAEQGRGAEAYGLFSQMQQEGFMPDEVTYVSILNPRAQAGALKWVKEVHIHALKAGLASGLRVGNSLIHMYAKVGSIADAQRVFDKMVYRDVVTWNVMIGGLADCCLGNEAFSLFLRMQNEGFKANSVTYVNILNPRASAEGLPWVKEVHNHALNAGLDSGLRVGSALVHMYAKSGSLEDARKVFDRMVTRDVITWNVMIGGLAEQGHGHEAFSLFLKMKQGGFTPDAITFASLLNPNSSEGALGWVKEAHRHALKAGLGSNVRVGTAFFHMYAKISKYDEARKLFDRMVDRDVMTWNVIIGLVAEQGLGYEALSLLLQMQRGGVVPTATTFVNILNPRVRVGGVEWVTEVHRHASEAGFESDIRVGNSLIHMCAKSGSIEEALRQFNKMVDRDLFTWNVMIGGLADHGLGREALQMFQQMMAHDVRPDGITHVAVLSACSHAGLVEEGRHHFKAMTQEYDFTPTVMHYNCMVDLLGRAGHLEEARLFIDNMPIEPNAVTWRTLLGACRVHNDVELAEFAAEEVLKREPEDLSGYLTLSNIYRAAGKWEEMPRLRSMVRGRGIRKEPGHSWIEVNNKIHSFVVGDISHAETEEIYAELKLVTEKLKGEGYIPDTQVILRDIGEEEKEVALCSHSERLAIAYGLMHIPPGKPIRIFKNLRVCKDCHTATKLISKVTGREIVARDASRFHHFKDGMCTCGDYW